MLGKVSGRSGVSKEKDSQGLFDNRIKWFTCVDAAIYLRKFKADGTPSVGAIRNLIYRGSLRARKFGGCLYLNREEIDRALDLALI